MKKEQKNNKSQVEEHIENRVHIEDAPQFPFLLRRIIEIFIISIISSAPFAFLFHIGIIPQSVTWGYRIFGASIVIFAALNVYFFRVFFYSMGSIKIYFKVNLVAYSIFAALSIALLCIFGDSSVHSLYSYLFMDLKFWTLVIEEIISTSNHILFWQITSAIFSHLILIGVLFLSPAEMYRIELKFRK